MTLDKNYIPETKTFTNWADEDFANFMYENIMFSHPHHFGQHFYAINFSLDDFLTNFIFFKIRKTLDEDIKPIRMFATIQHPGMEEVFHENQGECTCVWMLSKTLKEEGELEIKDDQKYKFEFNKLISLSSYKQHRGLAPPDGARVTLVTQFNSGVSYRPT
tara:strand:+ start:302 stop:784 length:483 start_codon:yes stop_codon:yes gene_type:complete